MNDVKDAIAHAQPNESRLLETSGDVLCGPSRQRDVRYNRPLVAEKSLFSLILESICSFIQLNKLAY